MPGVNIFLSYRRDDSGHAGRLFDHLCRRFPGNVFRDVTGIAPGSDFVRELERKLDSCHVLVVVISKTWLNSTNRDGRRRLEDPRDFVRLEVAAGLRRDVCVVPVLVGGAAMPSAEELPDDLKALATRQAMEVTERDFEDDVLRLCQSVERTFGVSPPTPAAPPAYAPPESKKRFGWLKLGLALGGGAFLMFATLLVLAAISSPTPNPAPDSSAQMTAGGPTPAPPASKPSGPTTDPKKTTTPAATPAPAPTAAAPPQGKSQTPPAEADGPEESAEEEVFSPLGRWRVNRPDTPGVYVVYHLQPGYRLTARFNVANLLQGDAEGSWSYDPAAQQLVLLGTLGANGAPFRDVMQIRAGDGGRYAVFHSDLGDAVMSRQ